MSIQRTLALSGGTILFFFVLSGMVLPATYRVERTVTIHAPADTVFEQIVDLRKSEAWNPFKNADPTTVVTYTEITEGLGAQYGWKGENSGAGTLLVTAVEPGHRVRAHLVFVADGSEADTDWVVNSDDGETTTVRWAMWGSESLPVIGPYMALFVDRFVGPSFEDGLARLAEISEKTEAEARERVRQAALERAAAEAARATKAAEEALAAFALPGVQAAQTAPPGAAPVPGAPAPAAPPAAPTP